MPTCGGCSHFLVVEALDMRPIGGEGIVQLEPGSGWCDPMRCWRTETDAPDPDPDCTWEAREAQG